MHILELPSFFPPYGGLFCLDQSKALATLGHEVRIVANVQLSVRRSLKHYLLARTGTHEAEMDGITILRREMRGWPKAVRTNSRRWVAGVRQMVAEYISFYGKPHIIHAHCTKWAGYAAMLIANDHHIPYVITEHLSSALYREEFGPVSGNGGKTPWQLPLLRQALRKAAMVVPVSEELVDDLAPYFGRDYRHIPLSNTIDTDFFAYHDRHPSDGGAERPFTLCALGINVPRKAYEILIPAFLQFARKHPESRLLIAGRDTEKIAVDNLSGGQPAVGITLLGEVDKAGVRDILHKSDCLVLPTRSEAQGLVLLEAMSTGIRTITTEAAPRNVRIKGGCTIVPVDDIAALAEAMETVYSTPFTSGEALSRQVASLCSPRAVGLQLEKIFAQAQSQ